MNQININNYIKLINVTIGNNEGIVNIEILVIILVNNLVNCINTYTYIN